MIVRPSRYPSDDAFTLRPISPGAESLLCKQVKILDHGFITPLDYMGTDLEISRSARTCTAIEDEGRLPADDEALIRYLTIHRHTSPFEMCEVRFLCRMPIFVARQWIRHRTANVNEMSLRYSPPISNCYLPESAVIAGQGGVKQGRSDVILPPDQAASVQAIMERHSELSFEAYNELADVLGIARELARTVLPASLYTQWVWKIDVHNLLHFLGLRLDAHAQYEIRVYAQAMADFVAAWVPWTWAAYTDTVLNAMTLSGSEIAALRSVLCEGNTIGLGSMTIERIRNVSTNSLERKITSKSEIAAFKAKLARLFG